jgi:hypothetical protein
VRRRWSPDILPRFRFSGSYRGTTTTSPSDLSANLSYSCHYDPKQPKEMVGTAELKQGYRSDLLSSVLCFPPFCHSHSSMDLSLWRELRRRPGHHNRAMGVLSAMALPL